VAVVPLLRYLPIRRHACQEERLSEFPPQAVVSNARAPDLLACEWPTTNVLNKDMTHLWRSSHHHGAYGVGCHMNVVTATELQLQEPARRRHHVSRHAR